MNQGNWMERTGATKGKLALVGVLAIILVGVIVTQVSNYRAQQGAHLPKEPREAARTASQPPQEVPAVEPETASPEQSHRAVAQWPERTLQEIVRHDPLVVPSWYQVELPPNPTTNLAATEDPQSAAAAAAQRRLRNSVVLDELRQQGATIVVLAEGSKAAAIGEQRLRVGDTIEGFQISDITLQGVVLSEIASP
jgi:hypothetical protein